jgi:hypothetical protein
VGVFISAAAGELFPPEKKYLTYNRVGKIRKRDVRRIMAGKEEGDKQIRADNLLHGRCAC